MRYALIPARGGSKRIPRKNIRNFAGRPMIELPITSCQDSGLFDDIFVSTDSDEIADTADKLGAKVIWRAVEFADDFSTTTEVLQDALTSHLQHLVDSDWLYKIYATSPVTSELVKDFVEYAEKDDEKFCASVGKFKNHIQRALVGSLEAGLDFTQPLHANSRSQDLFESYFDAGKLYAARTSKWRQITNPLLEAPRGFLLPTWASVDIDNEDDWRLAELLFSELRD